MRLVQAGWLAFVAVVPVAWVIVRHTPLYDGLRHFLFVVPLLAVLGGASAALYLRARGRRVDGKMAAAALAGWAP